MENSKAFLDRCQEYDVGAVERIITDGIAYLGVELPRQSKVLLKPNVLSPHPPERHITTHPVVIEAMVRVLLDSGNEIVIADSCCVPGRTAHALERTGIADIGKRFDRVSVVPFEELPTRPFTNPDNRYLPEVGLSRILDDVAGVINMPKLKAHMLTRITAAVKNLLGCIPGGGKQQAHVKAPSNQEFSQLLVDLYGFIEPKILLNVIDGIVGLDGFGPGPGGRRKPANLVGLSADAVALDAACSRATRLDPQEVWTTRFAIERGLGSVASETNQDIEPVRFWLPKPLRFPRFLSSRVSGLQRRRPVLNIDNCKQCGLCAEICPVQCITMGEYPSWDYAKCIYCYCCHESCPHAAIKLKFSLSLART